MVIIGAVAIDIHKRERDFENVTLSDVDTIKGLIRFRDKLDIYFENKTDNFYKHAGNVQCVNQELISLYISLDKTIERCNFDSRQTKLIYLLQRGYTFEDIGRLNDEGYRVHGLTRRNSRDIFDTICKKIVDQNSYDWSICMHDNYLDTKFKRCNQCEELLPRTHRFYRYRNDLKGDGFYNYCRKCEK